MGVRRGSKPRARPRAYLAKFASRNALTEEGERICRHKLGVSLALWPANRRRQVRSPPWLASALTVAGRKFGQIRERDAGSGRAGGGGGEGRTRRSGPLSRSRRPDDDGRSRARGKITSMDAKPFTPPASPLEFVVTTDFNIEAPRQPGPVGVHEDRRDRHPRPRSRRRSSSSPASRSSSLAVAFPIALAVVDQYSLYVSAVGSGARHAAQRLSPPRSSSPPSPRSSRRS